MATPNPPTHPTHLTSPLPTACLTLPLTRILPATAQPKMSSVKRFVFELCRWRVGMPPTPPSQIVATSRHQGSTRNIVTIRF